MNRISPHQVPLCGSPSCSRRPIGGSSSVSDRARHAPSLSGVATSYSLLQCKRLAVRWARRIGGAAPLRYPMRSPHQLESEQPFEGLSCSCKDRSRRTTAIVQQRRMSRRSLPSTSEKCQMVSRLETRHQIAMARLNPDGMSIDCIGTSPSDEMSLDSPAWLS